MFNDIYYSSAGTYIKISTKSTCST